MTDFILGLDFLHANNVTIQFGSKELSIDPRRTLSTIKDMTIPSKTETVITACVQGQNLPQGVLGISSGNVGYPEGLIFGNALCHIKDGETFLRVANFTDRDIKIQKGDAIGKFCCLARDDSLVKLPDTKENCPKEENVHLTPPLPMDSEWDQISLNHSPENCRICLTNIPTYFLDQRVN